MSIPTTVSDDFIVHNPDHFTEDDVRAARHRINTKTKKPKPKPKKAIRQKTKGPNPLERDFHQWLIAAGAYDNIRPQGIGIRLANGVVYWPDFSCVNPGGKTIIFETKGQRKATGQAKIKIAAHCHPEWTFIYVERKPKKDGGGWNFQHILP